MRWSLVMASVVGLLAAGVLVGCSSGPELTFHGAQVSEVGGSLTALDAGWRDHLSRQKEKVNAPEGSRCYLQLGLQNAVQDKAICGPMHVIGADASSWESVDLVAGPASDDVSKALLHPANGTYRSDVPLPNAAMTREDGSVGDPKAEAPAPDMPAAAAGTVYPQARVPSVDVNTTTGSTVTPTEGSGASVKAPGRSYEVFVLGNGKTLVSKDGTWVTAPGGGAFVTVAVTDRTSNVDTQTAGGADLTWKVTSGTGSWPLAIPPHVNGSFASGPTIVTIAVPRLGEATLEATGAGVTQRITLKDGKRVAGSQADGYYVVNAAGSQSCSRDYTTGGPGKAGIGVKAECQITLTRTAYALGRWAAAGKMFVVASISLYPTVDWRPDATSELGTGYATHDLALHDVTLDGVAPVRLDVERPPIGTTTFTATAEVPLADTESTVLTFSGSWTGLEHSDIGRAKAPDTLAASYPVTLPVRMRHS